ncbi:Hpt domain-containing protein [bacterium]|nr:Hpt domain-containing protein [bacterium]MBU1995360.1 Hpt domain-containing protein [bacterium]
MLIYNHNREFLGIDKHDLEALGFKDLSQLLKESSDFADLFVKTPGYVHNFKHVHWIDFITCAESSENSKVIIHANNKNYKCIIDISTAYLIDNPSLKAYLVNLTNLKILTHEENEKIAQDVLEKSVPKTTISHNAKLDVPELTTSFNDFQETVTIDDPYASDTGPQVLEKDIIEDISEDSSSEIKIDDIPEKLQSSLSNISPVADTQDNELRLDLDDIHVEFEEETSAENITFDDSYVFDPQVASDELGLPVDLIEEFIQDFINQAEEFKENLYSALKDNDHNNVKILSHKLKGVAANLRVEDAFEALSTINTSDNNKEIKANLDAFYKIIRKLSGKEIGNEQEVHKVSAASATVAKSESEDENYDDFSEIEFKDDDDMFSEKEETATAEIAKTSEDAEDDDSLYIDFKDDTIEDSHVPQKIAMAELADDEFLNNQKDDLYEIDDNDLLLEANPEEDENILLTQELSVVALDSKNEEQEAVHEPVEEKKNTKAHIITETKKEIYIPMDYNKKYIANEIGIAIESFNELFEDFVHESALLIESIHSAIAENNSGMWKKSTIKLKGMSDNMRVKDFTQEFNTLIGTEDSNIAATAANSISMKLMGISKI